MNKQILTKINKDRHEKTKTDKNQQIYTRINKYRQESSYYLEFFEESIEISPKDGVKM